jgi:hypothetical protein
MSPPKHLQVITALVKDHEARVAEIDKEIQILVERRTAYTNIINEHAPYIAPVRRLSPDVLALIFQACICNESTTLAPPLLSKNHPAVIASHVCAEWRKLVLNNPLLWTDLVISVPKHPRPMSSLSRAGGGRSVPAEVRDLFLEDVAEWEERMIRLKDTINAWIARSANCPVNITFTCTDPPHSSIGRDAKPLIPDVVTILTDISARWRGASFSVTVRHVDSPLRQLLTLPVHQVPILEKFHLELGLPWGGDMFAIDIGDSDEELPLLRSKDLIPSVTLFKAPSLRSLKVDNGQRHWANAPVPVNWSTLTELCLGKPDDQSGDTDTEGSDDDESPSNLTVDRVLVLLKSCPNLVRFGINVNHGAPRLLPLPLPTPISLLKLESIELRGVCLPIGFAASLDFPSLRRVSIIWRFEQTRNAEESELLDFFRHLGDGLTDVTFDYACLSQDALLSCLELLPNVVCLRLVNSGRSYFRQVYYNHGDDQPEEVAQAHLTNSVLQKLTPKLELGGNGKERVVEAFLCPKLKKFGARISLMEFLPQALVDFIAARRKRLDDLDIASHHHVTRLDTVIVAFKVPKRVDVRKALEDRNVDLEDFELKTTYREVPNALLARWKDNSWYDPDSVLEDVPIYANVY